MNWINWWKKNEIDDEIQGLEKKLQLNLVAVSPRPEFVNQLRRNLLKQISVMEYDNEPKTQKLLNRVLITGGVLGSFAMILTGIRGVLSVVGIIGLLINILKQNSHDAPISSRLA